MRAFAFAVLRELSHQHFVSGTELAQKFAVSRSAISDALMDASAAGVEIFKLTRRGYRLAQPLDLLHLETLHTLLGEHARRLDIDVLDTTASTNTALALRAAAGAGSGTCVAAEWQTAGRGRRGRVWQSSLGGSLVFSLLWRFEGGAAQLAGLSLVVGATVAHALDKLGVANVGVKWPNDIVVANRKLGGILIESQGDMLGPTAAVVGIGLNVRLSPSLEQSIDQAASDIAANCGDTVPSRNVVLAKVLTELVDALPVFASRGFAAFLPTWRQFDVLQGREVRVLQEQTPVWSGVACGVREDGALLVRHEGRIVALTSAEVSVRAQS